jgi:recombination protein RecA
MGWKTVGKAEEDSELQQAAENILHRKDESSMQDDSETQTRLLIPTGSVLLNLACSDRIDGGWGAGKIANLIGDSSSGKTLLALSMFAECANRPEFDGYDFIYDDVEQACEFDMGKLFGPKVTDRIQAPQYDGDSKLYSDTIQQFHANVFGAIESGRPFIYVLDSFDALTSVEELGRAEESAKATRDGKELKGSYRMEKPKLTSELLRQIKARLRESNSFLLIISQTRDNIDPMSFEKKTRSGGKALRFYSSHEVWMALAGKIKAKDRVIGSNVKVKVSKNKLTGKQREVQFPIYYDYGVDDLGSCIDFLVSEGYWQKKGDKIVAKDLGLEGMRRKLIQDVEGEIGMAQRVYQTTQICWKDVEDSLKLDRKPKYA